MALPSWAVDLPLAEVHEAAKEFGIDPNVIMAIIKTESGGNGYLLRAEPKFEWLVTPARFAERLGITKDTEVACQKISWGHMQLMGGTARDMGYDGLLTHLIIPACGIYYATKYFAILLKRHKFLKSAVAAYNAGSVRLDKDGQLVNQKYVDRVMGYFEQLR